MQPSNLVIRCEDGVIVEESVRQGDIEETLKQEIVATLKAWDPKQSDLMVFSTQNEARVSAPITKEMLELLKPYSPSRQGDEVVFNLPIYVIAYKIENVSGKEFRDRAVVIVAPYISDELKAQLERWGEELTAKE